MPDVAQTPLELDHVILCLPDLEGAVTSFEKTTGLASVAGGSHQGHGTANRIVPLSDTYLELVTVVDHTEAMMSLFGAWVAERCYRSDPRADAVCFRTANIRLLTDRLGLDARSMSRVTENGRRLEWTIAGLEEAFGPERLPFFIQWHIDAADHPGQNSSTNSAVEMVDVTISGSVERLSSWLGGPIAGIHLEEGPPGARQLGIRASDGGVLVVSGA